MCVSDAAGARDVPPSVAPAIQVVPVSRRSRTVDRRRRPAQAEREAALLAAWVARPIRTRQKCVHRLDDCRGGDGSSPSSRCGLTNVVLGQRWGRSGSGGCGRQGAPAAASATCYVGSAGCRWPGRPRTAAYRLGPARPLTPQPCCPEARP
jgi:hypothetical protein